MITRRTTATEQLDRLLWPLPLLTGDGPSGGGGGESRSGRGGRSISEKQTLLLKISRLS